MRKFWQDLDLLCMLSVCLIFSYFRSMMEDDSGGETQAEESEQWMTTLEYNGR